MPHIIVFGNEKGGSGKTTSSMHLIVSLLKLGYKIGSIDLDSRQKSLTSYIENRANTAKFDKIDLSLPTHFVFERNMSNNLDIANAEDEKTFISLLDKLNDRDFIIIDSPGSDTYISRFAHSYADTIVTPINDSFVDVDLLGKIDANQLDIVKPGVYSAMLWEQKLKKASKDKKAVDWVVIRNRISATNALNKRNIEQVLEKLAKKFGFRIIPGFGERVIFRELFLYGLTLHDMDKTNKVRYSVSIVTARQELRDFIGALQLPGIAVPLKL